MGVSSDMSTNSSYTCFSCFVCWTIREWAAFTVTLCFKYFNIYFLRTRAFILNSMIQWSNLRNLALLQYYYLICSPNSIFANCPNIVFFSPMIHPESSPRSHMSCSWCLFFLPQSVPVLTVPCLSSNDITEQYMPVVL